MTLRGNSVCGVYIPELLRERSFFVGVVLRSSLAYTCVCIFPEGRALILGVSGLWPAVAAPMCWRYQWA